MFWTLFWPCLAAYIAGSVVFNLGVRTLLNWLCGNSFRQVRAEEARDIAREVFRLLSSPAGPATGRRGDGGNEKEAD
jgi:hypothetical protein